MKTVEYLHHGTLVTANAELVGQHRRVCLCHHCENLNVEDREKNCPAANALFDLCVKFNLVTPVTECPVERFRKKAE